MGTIGQFLCAAEQRLREIGGYMGYACLDTRQIWLTHAKPQSDSRFFCLIERADLGPQEAIEDAAHALLDKTGFDAQKRAFANTYFPTGFL